MNFANVKNITIPEGSVTKITDSLGRILWKKNVTPTYVVEAKFTTTSNNQTVRIISQSTTKENLGLEKILTYDGVDISGNDTYTIENPGSYFLYYHFKTPTIPSYAFYNDVNYDGIWIEDEFEVVESYAFSGYNKSFHNVKPFNAIKTKSFYNFGIKESVTSRVLKINVKEVEYQAFYNVNVTKFEFSSELTSFNGNYVIYQSLNTDKIVLKSNSVVNVDTTYNLFYNLHKDLHIMVPQDLYQSYKNDTYWSRYSDIIRIIS